MIADTEPLAWLIIFAIMIITWPNSGPPSKGPPSARTGEVQQ